MLPTDRVKVRRSGRMCPAMPGVLMGAADTGPGTIPQGATPKVPRTSGDPLADAREPDER
jgi:hypothetical protein